MSNFSSPLSSPPPSTPAASSSHAPSVPPSSVAPLLASPRKRNKVKPLNMCGRCLHHFVHHGVDGVCNARLPSFLTSATQKKRCSRCVQGKHACEEIKDQAVVADVWSVRRARDVLAALLALPVQPDDYSTQVESAQEKLETTKENLKASFKMYHTNKNKVTGETHTGSKGGAGGWGAPNKLLAEHIKNQQQSNTLLKAVVEIGALFLRSVNVDTASVDAILGQVDASSSESEDPDETGEDGDEEE